MDDRMDQPVDQPMDRPMDGPIDGPVDGMGLRAGAEGAGGVFTGRQDRRKVTDWVYEEIRQAIIDLRLRPGEPLREAAIASQLGVSKTPIREALSRLEQEGLVETVSFKGAVVSGYSDRDLE